jgi:hypothetical protein
LVVSAFSGGWGPAALVGPFSTSFPATEDPISQGGIWLNGEADGIDWENCKTNGSGIFANGFSTNQYGDNVCLLKPSYRSFSANHYAQGTVYRAGGYDVSHEIELYVRAAGAAHSWRGYEVYWTNPSGYINLVRWDGPLADFTYLADTPIGQAVTGDVLRMEVTGTTITIYKNGSQVMTHSDSTWSSGQPGIGFGVWDVSTVLTNYGWSSFEAGDL